METKELSQKPPSGSLIPYYMKNIKEGEGEGYKPWCFNNHNMWGSYSEIVKADLGSDPFHLNNDAYDISQRIPARYS